MRNLSLFLVVVWVVCLAGCFSPSAETQVVKDFGADGTVVRETTQSKTESLVKSVLDSTRDKSIAAGSDTWGGGGEATMAEISGSPFPTLSGWFGRRRVWYVSIKTPAQGRAAAEVVKASNTSVSAGVTTSGITVAQGSEDETAGK